MSSPVLLNLFIDLHKRPTIHGEAISKGMVELLFNLYGVRRLFHHLDDNRPEFIGLDNNEEVRK